MTVEHAVRPLIVVEPEHQGHRMLYFAAVAEHLLARGTGVALATSAAGLRSDDLALRLPDAERVDRIDLGDADALGSGPRAVVRLVAGVQARYPDHEILVTEGDKFLPAALLTRAPLDWSTLRVLVMRAPTGRGGPRAWALDAVKAAAMRRAAGRGADVRVLEQSTPPRAVYRGGRGGRWPSVPDPVDVRPDGVGPAELAGLDRSPGRVWIGVLGHVAPRKNLDLVLDAARLTGPHVGVLVAGRVMPEEWTRCADAVTAFRDAGGALGVVDRLLTDDELDACVAWVDAVALAHSSEGPSGILGKAVALGTPVLTAGARSLRAEAERLAAGAWAPLRAPDMAAALRVLTSVRRPRRPRPLAGSAEFARALLDDPGPDPRAGRP